MDVRTLNSANIGNDHKLLLCKLCLSKIITHKPKSNIEHQSKITLYQTHLPSKISQNYIENQNASTEQHWETLKSNIIVAGHEAI